MGQNNHVEGLTVHKVSSRVQVLLLIFPPKKLNMGANKKAIMGHRGRCSKIRSGHNIFDFYGESKL
jgi:hypothetical protein